MLQKKFPGEVCFKVNQKENLPFPKKNHLPPHSSLNWKVNIEQLLSEKYGRKVSIENFHSVGGGCINDCFALTTTEGNFFLKKNSAKEFPKMFEAEAKGLELLNRSVESIAPGVVAHYEDNESQFLVLEFIVGGNPMPGFWVDFANKLSRLHQTTRDFFGLEHDNYIGSLPQKNQPLPDWNSFFIGTRIEPMLKMAVDEKKFSNEAIRSFEKLYSKLQEIFPPERPALVHGDLWSGNFMVGSIGLPRLIDPAVYFGHREMDLSMTKLFGGFDRSFYDHYNEYAPLEKGFEKRVDICNLYPLLVHVNLFGGYYAQQVMSIIKRFS